MLLPVVQEKLHDPEEKVVFETIENLKTICELGITERALTFECLDYVLPLLMHPNHWIREAVLKFIFTVNEQLSAA